jgi:phage-related protein
MPFSRALGKGLFELRIIDKVHVRFIYTFCDGSVWIIHGFVKKRERIPPADIEYARKELKKLLRLL